MPGDSPEGKDHTVSSGDSPRAAGRTSTMTRIVKALARIFYKGRHRAPTTKVQLRELTEVD